MVRYEVPAEGTVITASFQESGRGQAGNGWESEPGLNLLMSLILYPVMVSPAGQFIICEAVSLAVRDLLLQYIPSVSVKWPNDIYAGDGKIAGILIENSVMGDTLASSIVGIGLNVNQTHFGSGAPNPVSLRQLTGRKHDLSRLSRQLFSALDRRYAEVTAGRSDLLDAGYHAALYRRDRWHQYSDRDGRFEGMIEGVVPGGMLKVRRRDGPAGIYAFREIEYIL